MLKIIDKLRSLLPASRGQINRLENDLILFIDIMQEYELMTRNDIRATFGLLSRHIEEESSVKNTKTNKPYEDKYNMYG